jgi:HPt (histidine-containing phosphotransfer) domain-containing protein
MMTHSPFFSPDFDRHSTSLAQALDMEFLNEQTLGDESLVRELLTLFMNQAVGLLRQAHGAMQGQVCREAVHKLNGSARAIGAWPLAECASDIEYELINNNFDLSFLHEKNSLKMLEDEVTRVQKAILCVLRESLQTGLQDSAGPSRDVISKH